MRAEIVEYYRRGGETQRLADGAGRLEFLRTWDILSRELPPPPAGILDVGGATGVYAGPLAEAGYSVHVVDPMPDHVVAAAALPGVTAAVGDARELAEPDGSVDAVLLFGPLYHLPERADRLLAWREAARVTRPGGVVLGATISRFASLLDGFVRGFASDPDFVSVMRRGLSTGVHRNTDDVPRWFTTAYFHRLDEIPAEVAEAGLTLERLVAVEGPLWMAAELPAILADGERTAFMLEMLSAVEAEPSLLGSSSHQLTVARRPVS